MPAGEVPHALPNVCPGLTASGAGLAIIRTGENELPGPMRRERLIISSERHDVTLPRHARRMEDLHEQVRRQLAVSRLSAQTIGLQPEAPGAGAERGAEESAVEERTALDGGQHLGWAQPPKGAAPVSE